MPSKRIPPDEDVTIVLLTNMGEAWSEDGMVFRRGEMNGESVILAMSVDTARGAIAALTSALQPALVSNKDEGTNGNGH